MTKMLEPIMLFVAVTHMPDTRDFIRPAYRGQGQSPSPPPHLPGIPQARHGVVWLVEARAVARRYALASRRLPMPTLSHSTHISGLLMAEDECLYGMAWLARCVCLVRQVSVWSALLVVCYALLLSVSLPCLCHADAMRCFFGESCID